MSQEYAEVWDDGLPPGGFVCSICGMPVESEPCPEHGSPPHEHRWVTKHTLHEPYLAVCECGAVQRSGPTDAAGETPDA